MFPLKPYRNENFGLCTGTHNISYTIGFMEAIFLRDAYSLKIIF